MTTLGRGESPFPLQKGGNDYDEGRNQARTQQRQV